MSVKYFGTEIYRVELNGADIFYTDASALDITAAKNAVSAYRREKAERYRRECDVKCSLAAELLLSYALESKNIRVPFEFGETKLGKPYFVNAPDLHFSISHSNDMAMCAFSDVPVGVDCERNGRTSDAVLEKHFTHGERAAVEKGAMTFSEVWTRKEAVAKCEGTGICVGLVNIDTSRNTVELNGKTYTVQNIPVRLNGYVAAVSLQSALHGIL